MEFSKTLLFVLIFGSTLLAIIATMQRDNDPLLWEGIDLEGFESPTVKDLYKMTGYYKAKNMVALKAASRMDRLYLLTPR